MITRHSAIFRSLIIVLAGLCAFTSRAITSVPDSLTQISLLVASPGTEVYELEGHAAMRIVNPHGDFTVNWGLFNFDEPHFVYRFVKGETDYGIGAQTTQDFLATYSRQGRGVTEIPLRLTPDEVGRVLALVDSTLRPPANVYRYNYVRDNCSTRPVGIIEQAVGDTLTMEVPAEFTSHNELSFRKIMEYYHRYYPWYQFGIDLALGSGIDYPITPHEMAFAPVLLPELLATAKVGGRTIADQPRELVVAQPWPAKPTPWYLTPMFVACLVLALTAWVTVRDVKAKRVSQWFDAILFGLFGVMGCIIAFLVFISFHEATSPNWLILWLNPFALIPVALMWIKSCLKIVYCYHFINFVALIFMAMAWPFLGQAGNLAFIPLILADATRSLSYLYVQRCTLTKAKSNPA